jgi:Tim10/DDP family zinc finger
MDRDASFERDEADYAYYEQVATKLQAKQALNTFLDLTHGAFEACISNFTTNVVTPAEKKCLQNVTKKYIACSLRVSQRFAELQEAAAKEGAAQAATTRGNLQSQADALSTELKGLK